MRINLMKKTLALFVLFCFVAPCMAQTQRVRMQTGDVFVGQILQRNAEHIVMQNALLGRVTLPVAQVAAVESTTDQNTASEKQPVALAPAPQGDLNPSAAAPTPPAIAPAPPKSYLAKLLETWKVRLALGANSRRSNVNTTDISARISAKHTDKTARWDLSAQYFYQQRDNNNSRNDFHLAVRKDWLFPESPWFIFGQAEWDRDEFKSWDHRLSAHGGVGYDLKNIVGLEAELRAGGGITREFGGDDPKIRPESLFSSGLTWNLAPKHKITGAIEVFPSIDRSDEYRIRAQADWTYKFTDNVGLSIGYWNEYDSAVPAGYQNNDTRVFGSVVFDF